MSRVSRRDWVGQKPTEALLKISGPAQIRVLACRFEHKDSGARGKLVQFALKLRALRIDEKGVGWNQQTPFAPSGPRHVEESEFESQSRERSARCAFAMIVPGAGDQMALQV